MSVSLANQPTNREGSMSTSTTTSSSEKGAVIDLTALANENLAQYVKRLEELELEKREIAEEIKETLQKAEDQGHNKTALRATVRIKLMSREQRLKYDDAQDALDQMLAALGLLGDTPLGEAALEVAKKARRK
jgi:uncharacterized protein (UPF0335 family)